MLNPCNKQIQVVTPPGEFNYLLTLTLRGKAEAHPYINNENK
jgi:hypothetical protein